MHIDSKSQQTLEFGPIWLFSALTGRHRNHDVVALESFWSIVQEVGSSGRGLAEQFWVSLRGNAAGRAAEFDRDERSVSAGFSEIIRILDRLDAPTAAEYKQSLLSIGYAFARAQGPFGRKVGPEDGQTLILLAQMLDFWSSRDALADLRQSA